MLTHLLPAVAALAMSAAVDGPESSPAADKPGITAEVRGTLRFENGHGYYVVVPPDRKGGPETRVRLRAPEDKILIRQLEKLDGRAVVAAGRATLGPTGQKPEEMSQGLFLEYGFTIRAAAAK